MTTKDTFYLATKKNNQQNVVAFFASKNDFSNWINLNKKDNFIYFKTKNSLDFDKRKRIKLKDIIKLKT